SNVTQQVEPATRSTSTIVTTDQPCDNTVTTVIPSLAQGDVVNIQAEVAATNGEDTFTEQGEKEFLKIFDTAGTFTREVDYLASKQFNFTVTSSSDSLKACIEPGVDLNPPGPDGDELGTVGFTITSPP